MISDSWRDTYDDWKLATPPEYDADGFWCPVLNEPCYGDCHRGYAMCPHIKDEIETANGSLTIKEE